MKKKEISRKMARELKIKSEDSEKMLDFILKEILESGLTGEGFSSSILKVVSKDRPEKVEYTHEGQKVTPARKVMSVMPSKKYVSSTVN